MSRLEIKGGRRLKGEIEIEGSKNAVLPILAASVLNSGISVIKNCPKLKDVDAMVRILRRLGCRVVIDEDVITVDSSALVNWVVPEDIASEMRSSIVFMGPLLARCGKVILSYPGGCEIGPRPIDLHLKALKKLGARIDEIHKGLISCEIEKLVGCDIHLDYPSVGATENAILASVFAEGETYIRNAAKEPEITDLQNYLVSMGVKVSGAGTGVVQVKGVKRLSAAEHRIMPDRIVAGTYMIAAAMNEGDVRLNGIIPGHLHSVISILRDTGCDIDIGHDTVRIIMNGRPKPVDTIRTLPYPGFPTDMQPQMVALLTIGRGTSIVVETVFENRYRHVEELLKMNADITLEGRVAVIKGVKSLAGACVNAKDLRSGAALVLAGTCAEGDTVVNEISHIDRGYEEIEKKLNILGADIRREEKDLQKDQE